MKNWVRIAEKIKKAPKIPGVYIFYDREKPLYVGKASNLRSRLSSYLAREDFKNNRLQENSARLELLPLRSEIETLLKESEMIKKFGPPYNVLWRDDKSYFYALFTNPFDAAQGKDKFPRIFVTHKNLLTTNHQPLTTNIIGPFTEGRALRLVLRMLRRNFPYCTCPKPHLRTCLNAQIGNCFGFCCRRGTRPNAGQRAQYPKNIRTIKNFLLGKPLKNFAKTLKPEERGALEKILAHREFLDDTLINADVKPIYADNGSVSISQDQHKSALLIEGYDISHLAGREVVAGMTAWSFSAKGGSASGGDGTLVPRKDFWRKFIIRTAKPADDPAAMRETVSRRLRHPEWPYPNIMIIDGGLTQFRAARTAVREAGLEKRIEVRSFAKPEQLVYGPDDKTTKLGEVSEGLKKIIPAVIMQTHNFAVRFHRNRRKKAFLPPEWYN